MRPTFNLCRVDEALAGTLFHGKLHHFPVIESTNSRALADAQAGAESGQVYIADEQTAGRGRRGHTWHSEPERGLYLTMLVRPALTSNAVLTLSLLTALAAAAAIEQVTALRIDLRWPNDLVVGSGPARKLGGILTEAASTPAGALRHAAIGIGINLNQADFPPELAGTATSLLRESGAAVSREALAVAFLREMDAELRGLTCSSDDTKHPGGVLRRFEERSTWACGKHVRVDEDGGYTGVTDGLTADGLLRVRRLDGSERVVRHGGVREL